MKKIILSFGILLVTLVSTAQRETDIVTLKAPDGLEITTEVYTVDESRPYMLLFHQAGFSRGEYMNTAKMFTNFGYNCIAVDQRSGEIANDVANKTAGRAKSQGLSTKYMDAYQDMQTALDHAFETSGKKVVVVGSSYSAALVLKLAMENPEKISKVLAYSPGEYIKGHSVADWAKALKMPVFVTSSKTEAADVKTLFEGSTNDKLVHFVPEEEGIHGSRALWKDNPNNHEYWVATRMFLTSKEK